MEVDVEAGACTFSLTGLTDDWAVSLNDPHDKTDDIIRILHELLPPPLKPHQMSPCMHSVRYFSDDSCMLTRKRRI